jgi:CRISPR/Cas system-associated exonuclease Cas4 (RecB family)
MKLYNLCRKEDDVELAFIASTSIGDERKREATLGSLIEDLIVKDSLSKLLNCKLSNKNLVIFSSYLKKKIYENLKKVFDNSEREEDLEYFNADRVFLKLLKSLVSLFKFYNKPRESCQFMIKIYFELQEYKYGAHRHISYILGIEKYILGLILAETKTFDNPDKYLFYIKENDYYNVLKKRGRDEDMAMEVDDISLELINRFFTLDNEEGKYILRVRDLEGFSAINEAQIKIFMK